MNYVGRLAPSPTGRLHLGHAVTFRAAHNRAQSQGGTLRLRFDDLDSARCRPEFIDSILDDLEWIGCNWEPPAVYQSQRTALYQAAFEQLSEAGRLYPCTRSRKEIRAAGQPGREGEVLFPPQWRDKADSPPPPDAHWRFKVPDGRTLHLADAEMGNVSLTAGEDFGDFIVWTKDGHPAYELATVLDEEDLGITEVVRGQDLLTSSVRQLLIFEALGLTPPAFRHLPLVCGPDGRKLSKRDGALSLESLRKQGLTFEESLARINHTA